MNQPDSIDPLHFDLWRLKQHRVVKFILRRLGDDPSLVRRISDEQYALDGHSSLTLSALNNLGELSIELKMSALCRPESKMASHGRVSMGGQILDGQVAHLIVDFRRSALGREYLHVAGKHRPIDQLAIGIVFPFRRVPGGFVIHNGKFAKRFTAFHTDVGEVRVERLAEVIAHASTSVVAQDVTQLVVGAYGDTIAARVLLAVLKNADVSEEPVRVRTASQQQLLRECNCSRRGLQVALQKLQVAEVVTVFPAGRINQYRVDMRELARQRR